MRIFFSWTCRAGEPSLWSKGTPSAAAAVAVAEREKLAEEWAALDTAKHQLLLEQQALHEKLKSNDAALARVAKALEDRLPAPPSSG